ncbi:MAG TPA: biopolymer transporter ExbD [Rhizomicrobium sp.]|jgi:biopolymer transport protein ExbD|nr:biopolymer transporter ExbD [Rhizomicrobium sp.]
MSISVHSADTDEPELNTTINTTPLVDVMLVLLIVFLITVPVVLKQIPVNYPNARNIPTQTKPENIVIAVDKDEDIYWNNAPIDVTQLRPRFVAALRTAINKGGEPPEVHIRGDRDARFEAIGKVILAVQQAGIQKVAFITEPRNEGQ